MKLYTKEMFLIAAEKCEVSMIDAKHIMQYIDEYVTPIELPTDEDIETEASGFSKKYRATTYEKSAYVIGAKWMRNKINKV
jgi:hypothetical protein